MYLNLPSLIDTKFHNKFRYYNSELGSTRGYEDNMDVKIGKFMYVIVVSQMTLLEFSSSSVEWMNEWIKAL